MGKRSVKLTEAGLGLAVLTLFSAPFVLAVSPTRVTKTVARESLRLTETVT